MAFFAVTIEEIDSINPIPGADLIQVATVKGMAFTFVIAKDAFSLGDKVLYFPIDSLLPAPLANALGVAGKLAGKDKDRLKTVRLRGVLSQGLVGKLNLIDTLEDRSPESITRFLGVAKYDPPEVICQGGRLTAHVSGVSTYDIEGADRYPAALEKLLDQAVFITEKVEGSNWYGGVDDEGHFVVGQRSGSIIAESPQAHTWWSTAMEQGILDAAKAIQAESAPGTSVIFRGEIAGGKIQGNYYGMPKVRIYTFDLLLGGRYAAAEEFLRLARQHQVETAPVLACGITLREWLNQEGKHSIKDASHGMSRLAPVLREGIVIKPLVEQYDDTLKGRLFIKQRDPIYLDKTGN